MSSNVQAAISPDTSDNLAMPSGRRLQTFYRIKGLDEAISSLSPVSRPPGQDPSHTVKPQSPSHETLQAEKRKPEPPLL